MFGRNRLLINALVLVLIGIGLAILPFFQAEEYVRFKSPDGRHALIVYRYPMVFASPGQGGDASGYVLLTNPSGQELQRKTVDMVQMVHNPQWSQTGVRVRMILDWPR